MYSYNKNKKKLNYMILIIMILVISIGYAILSTNLNIIGTGTINNPTWDIHWENVQVKTGSVSASTPTIDTAKTTVNYSVTLSIPGEYYEFTVDAVNAGTIDGMVSVVSNKLNNVEITTLPNYLEYKVTYEDGVDIAPNHLLAANSSEKYKVHVGYKKDISVSDIPATPQTLNLSFSVTYVQSNSNSEVVPHSRTVYTVNIMDESFGDFISRNNPTVVWLEQSIHPSITQYNSAQDAMAAFSNKPFYLKHRLDNNIVTEFYVEFVVTEEMADANPEMTAGTYDLIGSYITGLCKGKCHSEYYEINKQILLSAFGNAYCNESYDSDSDPDRFNCSISGLHAYTSIGGYIGAYDGNYGCTVSTYGSSFCSNNS